MRAAPPEELRDRLAMPPPEAPAAFEEILAGLERDVLPFVGRISHPGYVDELDDAGPDRDEWFPMASAMRAA